MISEEAKIYLRGIIPFVVILGIVPLLSFLIWQSFPSKKFEILIVNKTVPNESYQEHKSIFWILDYKKFTKSNSTPYDLTTDYVGFHPDGSDTYGTHNDFSTYTDQQIIAKVAEQDLIYYVDTYGVFENDFLTNENNEISKKIYGGLNKGDIRLLKEAKKQNKTVIAEFNSMASPTPKAIRTEFEEIMGIQWTGWIARYFDELDSSINKTIPNWLIERYVTEHQISWDFEGSGLIFINEDGRIDVFKSGVDYKGELPIIRTLSNLNQGFKLPEFVPYPDWFDIVLISRDYQVISYYDINPSLQGEEKLKKLGLPKFFPAAVVKNNSAGDFYYFSGDFAESKESFGSSKFYGVPTLWRGFHLVSDYADRESFYWNYYFPLMSEIIKRASKD